jgi:hypothetical protein
VQHRSDDELIQSMDGVHARVSAGQREHFRLIAEVDRRETWRDFGGRDTAHWLSIRYGLSEWKARRWIVAAHALEALPCISDAFARGELGIDKVVELTRFASPETESRLVSWAQAVSCGAIRRQGDLAARQAIDDVREAERTRFLSWWYFDDGRRFGLEAELPAAQGAVVAKALERLADGVPVMPGEDDPVHVDARRADALVALCSTRISNDPDPDRATVVVHAKLGDPRRGLSECEIEDGPVIHPDTARRLACNGRIQTVVEDEAGLPIRLGRIVREPPAWMVRQLRYRDRECRFPGCGSRRFTQAHHIMWWQRGGHTDLANLLLVCSFHHRLVHEHGWSVKRTRDGATRWFRPDGRRYRAGPSPPRPESVPSHPAPGLGTTRDARGRTLTGSQLRPNVGFSAK